MITKKDNVNNNNNKKEKKVFDNTQNEYEGNTIKQHINLKLKKKLTAFTFCYNKIV